MLKKYDPLLKQTRERISMKKSQNTVKLSTGNRDQLLRNRMEWFEIVEIFTLN